MSQSLERTLRAKGKSQKTVYSCTPSSVDVSRDDIRDFIADQAACNSEATALVRSKSLQQF